MTRTVGVVTTSRADYSHLFWVLREIDAHPDLELRLFVAGAHLSEAFGRSIDEIRRDGFTVAATVPCLDRADDDAGMARTLARASAGFADVLAQDRPDLLLLIADRFEMLAPAAVATTLRIPIAHIEGGEISLGAIDDPIRNALTKLSHLHFVPHAAAEARVRAMGEESWRVVRSGAPSLDHLTKSVLPDRPALEEKLEARIPPETTLAIHHPLTVARDTLRETDAFYDALERIDGPIAFCFPNADAGGRALIARARAFCEKAADRQVFVNLHPVDYWGLLRAVRVLIGNSSSGIMESASFALPTVNVGDRQRGRERAANVLDAPADPDSIVDAWRRAVDPAFRESLGGLQNPFGDGRAAERIVRVLLDAPLGERLRVKAPVPVPRTVERSP